jgi:hypothetical protein
MKLLPFRKQRTNPGFPFSTATSSFRRSRCPATIQQPFSIPSRPNNPHSASTAASFLRIVRSSFGIVKHAVASVSSARRIWRPDAAAAAAAAATAAARSGVASRGDRQTVQTMKEDSETDTAKRTPPNDEHPYD